MPEVTDQATLKVSLEAEDLKNLLNFMKYPVGAKLALSGHRLAVRTEGGVEFEESGEVTLEFEMSDYIQDREGWRD